MLVGLGFGRRLPSVMPPKRKPAPGPNQRVISEFYRNVRAVADGPGTDDELDYIEEDIPEVRDLKRGGSRARPPRSEPVSDPESSEESADEEPRPSRPRRGPSSRRLPTPPPPPDGDTDDSTSLSSSSTGGSEWEPSRDDLPADDDDGESFK